jgi:glutaredoxin
MYFPADSRDPLVGGGAGRRLIFSPARLPVFLIGVLGSPGIKICGIVKRGACDMKIDIYGKAGCAKCKAVKTKLEHFLSRWGVSDKSVIMKFVDMNTIVGRAEGAFHDVNSVPTTILWDNRGQRIARWDDAFIRSNDLREYLGVPV